MKLTGELKDKVDQTTNLEEAKDVIAKAGMLLTDDEVSEVAGGARRPSNLLYKETPKVNFGNTLYDGDTNYQAGELLYKESESKGGASRILEGLSVFYDEEDPHTLHGPLGS